MQQISLSTRQIDSEIAFLDYNDQSKSVTSQKRQRRSNFFKSVLTPTKTKSIIPRNNIEQDPLQEYNQKKVTKQQLTIEQVQNEQLNKFHTEWHWKVFFEFLFYHLMFFVIFGPFVVILFFKHPGYTLVRNMKFFNHHNQFYFQLLSWIGSVLGGLMYFLQNDSQVTITEIIFMWFAITIRCVVISSKYATLSEERIQLYKNKELPQEVFQFDLMLFDWYYQSPKVLFLEQYRSLRRYEQEYSFYKFDFLVEPLEETKKLIQETHICFFVEWALKQSSIKQTDPIIDENFYNGFHIFGYIVNNYQKIHPPYEKFVFILPLIAALSPTLLRMSHYIQNTPNYMDIIRIIINIITSYSAFLGSFVFLDIGIYDFKRKLFILDQISYMLQAKKVKYSSFYKLLPTINFNNPQTLQAWTILRSLAFDYGQTYSLRTQGFYSLVFVANIIFLLLGLGVILNIIQIDLLQICLICEMALILIGYTSYFLYFGAKINQYQEDFETILDDVKSIYIDILRMKEQYFLNNVSPINEVHKIFVGILKEQSGININDINQDIQVIIDEIDYCIMRVNYDKRNNPFKLYGVVITFNLLKSVAVGISTIFSFAIQQRFQNS